MATMTISPGNSGCIGVIKRGIAVGIVGRSDVKLVTEAQKVF